jgi:hypothetical protein
VGEDGARAAREDGGHPAALAPEELGGDEGVDGRVDAVEATLLRALVHRLLRQPKRSQLVEYENRVLPLRERRDRLILRRLRV